MASTRRNTSYSRVKLKSERIAFGNKEHTKSRKSETRFDYVSSYEVLYMYLKH